MKKRSHDAGIRVFEYVQEFLSCSGNSRSYIGRSHGAAVYLEYTNAAFGSSARGLCLEQCAVMATERQAPERRHLVTFVRALRDWLEREQEMVMRQAQGYSPRKAWMVTFLDEWPVLP